MTTRLLRGDVLSFARHYQGEPFHALLCDPPYHLTSVVDRFGKGEPSHTKTYHDMMNRSTPIGRLARGFMGQTWDGGDLAFRPDTWAALSELLYPGAFLMCFAGTRGYHRMACAMEDAGLVIHPALGWLNGQGFPKATNIAKQLDGVLGNQSTGFNTAGGKENYKLQDLSFRSDYGYKYEPKSDLSTTWQSHRYGLQALKPAFEFIAIAQKPYQGKPVDSITRTGAGALNIDGARIGNETVKTNGGVKFKGDGIYNAYNEAEESERAGRWPANFVLDASLAPALDEMSGESKSGDLTGQPRVENRIYNSAGTTLGAPRFYKGDSGGASRFYFQADWNAETLERLNAALPVRYQAKAGRRERDAGLDNLPVITKNGFNASVREYDGEIHNEIRLRNPHPTCKPIALIKWLATLLLPPAAYAPRRLLVPFAGSGSEMIGAMLAGWETIIGVEREREYAAIGRARLAWWSDLMRWGHTDIDAMLRQWSSDEPDGDGESPDEVQLSLF